MYCLYYFSLFAFSCTTGNHNNSKAETCSCDTESILETTNVDATLISRGNLYGAENEGIGQQNMIITDQGIWDELVARMNSSSNVSGNFTEIDIDFVEYRVIVVFDEVKTNRGYCLGLDLVADPDKITVTINTQGVVDTSNILIQPYIIVKILRTFEPIIFQ